jgi:hypothetical protein
MSRRWYRYGDRVVFMGWEPSEQGFYLNLVDLCAECGGTGEIGATEEVCPGCAGEGIQLNAMMPSARKSRLTLEQLASELSQANIKFPDVVKADLEEDKRVNAGMVLHEYDLESET